MIEFIRGLMVLAVLSSVIALAFGLTRALARHVAGRWPS